MSRERWRRRQRRRTRRKNRRKRPARKRRDRRGAAAPGAIAPCRYPRASRCIREPAEARTERERRRARREKLPKVKRRSFVFSPHMHECRWYDRATTIVTLAQPFRILLYEILHNRSDFFADSFRMYSGHAHEFAAHYMRCGAWGATSNCPTKCVPACASAADSLPSACRAPDGGRSQECPEFAAEILRYPKQLVNA